MKSIVVDRILLKVSYCFTDIYYFEAFFPVQDDVEQCLTGRLENLNWFKIGDKYLSISQDETQSPENDCSLIKPYKQKSMV